MCPTCRKENYFSKLKEEVYAKNYKIYEIIETVDKQMSEFKDKIDFLSNEVKCGTHPK